LAFADRSGPDTNSRFVRDLFVITLTCDPPTSIDRMACGRSRGVILLIDCFLHGRAEATCRTRCGQADITAAFAILALLTALNLGLTKCRRSATTIGKDTNGTCL